MKSCYDFFIININFAIISVSSISYSEKLPSFKKPLTSHFNHPNSEYVDIDEGAIVKVEFSKTLRLVKNFRQSSKNYFFTGG